MECASRCGLCARRPCEQPVDTAGENMSQSPLPSPLHTDGSPWTAPNFLSWFLSWGRAFLSLIVIRKWTGSPLNSASSDSQEEIMCVCVCVCVCVCEVQFSSVTQLCPTLCDPMDCSTPGLPVHHQLPEFTQTNVHWVGDAIQPSHPLLSPSSPDFNLSQHQGLFQGVGSSYQVAKVLELQLQHQSLQWIFRTDFL